MKIEVNDEQIASVEAVLFALGEPCAISRLAGAVLLNTQQVFECVSALNERYEKRNSALKILMLGDSFQMATRERFAHNIKSAFETKRDTLLSNAAMEVLAVIAYNQPVTKAFIEQVRGTDSSSVVNNLVEKGLLEEHGRLDLPGRPIAYQTTDNFLRCFGISNIDMLPPIPTASDQMNFDEMNNDLENDSDNVKVFEMDFSDENAISEDELYFDDLDSEITKITD